MDARHAWAPRPGFSTILVASLVCVGIGLGFGAIDANGPKLSLAERVRAQEAIERVRYAHQSGATVPFEQAVPQDLLRRKVKHYLAQSAALETIWKVPLTASMLERELSRIAARTRMPRHLVELFDALDNDPLMIEECLVRPVLVDRLARSRFAEDPEIHAEPRAQAERLRAELLSGALDPWAEHEARSVADLHGDRDSAARVGDIGAVRDEGGAFVVDVVLEEEAGHLSVATYRFPKRTWDDWWPETSADLDIESVGSVAARTVRLPAVGAGSPPCVGEGWEAGVLGAPVPDRRQAHTAIWTGTEMIVWGGEGTSGKLRTGLRYDPAIDSWTPTSTLDAPSARTGHAAVWTGELMLVWGGGPLGVVENSGGRYDPVTDSWTPMSTDGAPSKRTGATGVWTGSRAIFWAGLGFLAGAQATSPCNCCTAHQGLGCDDLGCESFVCGFDSFCCNVAWDSICVDEAIGNCTCCPGATKELQTGGLYDPQTDSWSSTSISGAPSARSGHSAVWTGTHMVVWGGDISAAVNTGGRYDPTSNSWLGTSTLGAPSARTAHSAVWTGSDMIVWGGKRQGYLNTGGRYHPATNSWTPTALVGAPAARAGHTAAWTGSEMIVWGGDPVGVAGGTGGRYAPDSDSWVPTATAGAPAPRRQHTLVWTGSEAIVWGGGGAEDPTVYDSGGRYDPGVDSWTPTFSSGVPQGSQQHTAVWTGTHMVVWAGDHVMGGRYDPTLDSWTPVSTIGAPEKRQLSSAVWTGTTMIVWGGGLNSTFFFNTGGRYDPIADSWSQTSLLGAPSSRWEHTAAWTGTHMVIWGGGTYLVASDTGGRYDPLSDTWAPTSTRGAPSSRWEHTAVWAGTEMIVWGGEEQDGGGASTGGRYDPSRDAWTPTSIDGAPSARQGHTAIWSGDVMIVWGGAPFNDSTGGRYDPTRDAWLPTSLTDAPAPRSAHSAVWSGSEMIVWGGWDGQWLATGGRYDPVADAWLATPTSGAPEPRYGHTAVWTGDRMLVWGGTDGDPLATGGSYAPEAADSDGDGAGCVVDCDDSDPGVLAAPGAVSGVQFAADKVALQWTSMSAAAGDATAYDIVRGALPEFPVGSGGAELCLGASYTPSPGPDPETVALDDAELPASGSGFWYLVRATNGCGVGTYGTTSAGQERITTACP